MSNVIGKTINRKMVEAALILKQINGEVVQRIPSKVDLKHVYCASYTNSVIDGIDPDMFYSDLIKGDGGELSNASGSVPKFNSISSSASLAVSTFAPWKSQINQLVIDTGAFSFTGFDTIEFEHIAKTKIPGAHKHPNLDVWLDNDSSVLAVECKFCEYLSDRNETHTLHSAYKRLAAELEMDSLWVKAIEQVTNSKGECKYQYFDAVQILRHYFGVITSDKAEKHLLYLYWHPDNEDWTQIHPYNRHESELQNFAAMVSGADDVQFHYLSFNELWNQWALNGDPEVQKHVEALKRKYSVIIEEIQ